MEETNIVVCHFIIFYPKFHCGLNFIENFWGGSKMIRKEDLRVHMKRDGCDSSEIACLSFSRNNQSPC